MSPALICLAYVQNATSGRKLTLLPSEPWWWQQHALRKSLKLWFRSIFINVLEDLNPMEELWQH